MNLFFNNFFILSPKFWSSIVLTYFTFAWSLSTFTHVMLSCWLKRSGSLCATEIRELRVGSWGWLVLCSIEVPQMVLVVLRVRAEFGRPGERAHRTEILVETILYIVCGRGRRLLLGGSETVSWLRERALNSALHCRAINAFSCQVVRMVTAGARALSLSSKFHIKMTKLFAHWVRCAACLHSESVLFVIAFRSW